MLQFNSKGLLIPETVIPSILEEFELEFVIKPDNEKRRGLFHQYQSYCDNLKTICGNISLTQWVNGSFTTKSKDPADIDLVTFIDAGIVKKNEATLRDFVYPKSMLNYQMDAYIIVIHPVDSKMHFVTNADRLYWMEHFGNKT